jgi:hypothetical protein
MPYDQSWMGFGFVGGAEAGAITLVAAVLIFLLFHWIGRSQQWGHGRQIMLSFLVAVVLTGGQDLWNMFYFNFGNVQSLQLLQIKLAEVHDPDGMGTRVVCELAGAAIGVYIGWALCGGHRAMREA